jgi:hypothetical protein
LADAFVGALAAFEKAHALFSLISIRFLAEAASGSANETAAINSQSLAVNSRELTVHFVALRAL